jgi:hypothetical protein
VLSRRSLAFVLLIAALAGIAFFIQGFGLLDTIGALTCGAVAGSSLAEIAAAAPKGPRRI